MNNSNIAFIVYFRIITLCIKDIISRYKIVIVKVPPKHNMNYDCD